MKRTALASGLLATATAPPFALHDEIIRWTRPDGFQDLKIVVVPDPDDGKPQPPLKVEPSPWQFNGFDGGTGEMIYRNQEAGEYSKVDPKTKNIRLP